MKKRLKVFLNIILVFAIILSVAWGITVSGPGILNPGDGPPFWSDGDFWGVICIVVVPVLLVIAIWLINARLPVKK